ncbi:MAG: Rne/Rng family ribonuclease [Proteobacteria bacterium]|nr:Rne/Rng family ribonuclease [Pseudomonadota bacterium]
MTKRVLIDAVHGEEIRMVVLKDGKVLDYDVQSKDKTQNRGNIYVGVVNRVEPSLQSAFVEYGGNRNGFLPMSEVNPMFFQNLSVDEFETVNNEYRLVRSEKYNFIKQVREMLAMAEGGHIFPFTEPKKDARKPKAKKQTESRHKNARAKKKDFKESKAQAQKEVKDSKTEVKTEDKPKAKAKRSINLSEDKSVKKKVVEEKNVSVVATKVKAEYNEPTAKLDAKKIVIPQQDVKDEESKKIKVEKSTIALADSGNIVEALDENLEIVESKTDDYSHLIRLKTKTNKEQIDELKKYLQPLNRRYNIKDVLKVGQKILVQVSKEERGNKGAALTTNIGIPGRYSVLMTNVSNAGGVSRKITDPADRSELKSIVNNLEIGQAKSLIVRTAAIGQGKAAIERDYQALNMQWENILKVLEKESTPVCVHNDSNIITKTIRDTVSVDVDEVVISGEDAYREAKSYVKTIMPAYSKKVREHRAQLPLFSHYKVETELHKLHTTRVNFESGAYMIINPTEALVSIDINSGKSTSAKNIEDTALQTNVEAAEEIAKQLRLRDLSGLIVIDFIDMDSQDHERKVERALRNALRNDRAKTQTGFITEFGLLEMSRQRIRPTLEESMFKVCPHCTGTGRMRSPASSAITILRGIEEEKLFSKAEIIEVYTHTDVAVYMLNHKRDLIKEFENTYKVRIVVQADNNYMAPDYKVNLVRVGADGSVKRTSQEFILREKAEDLNQVDTELLGNLVKSNQIRTIDTKVSIPLTEEEQTAELKEVKKPTSKPYKNGKDFKKGPRKGPQKQSKTQEAFKRWWSGR